MKSLTIKQPWSSLIINGYKKYEFRSWKTNYRGKIYIHAGLGVDKRLLTLKEKYDLDYPKGYIIGEAKIVDCIYVNSDYKEKLLKENKEIYENASGYAFVLDDIIKYDNLIPCKGKLSFWEYEK